MRPLFGRLVDVGRDELDAPPDAGPVRAGIAPEIDARMLAERRQFAERLEIEPRVAQRLRPLQFVWLAAVGGDLRRDAALLGRHQNPPGIVLAVEAERQSHHLHVVVGAVIVVGGLLLTAGWAGEQPADVFPQPGDHRLAIRVGQLLGIHQEPEGIDGDGDVPGLENALGPPIGFAGHGLSVCEVRIHPRGGSDEPDASHLRGVRRIFFVAREKVGQRQGFNGVAHLRDPWTVVGPGIAALGVALAIAANIGPATRLRRVGPEIRREAHVVVPVAARRSLFLLRHRRRRNLQRLVSRGDEILDRPLEALVARSEPLPGLQERPRLGAVKPRNLGRRGIVVGSDGREGCERHSRHPCGQHNDKHLNRTLPAAGALLARLEPIHGEHEITKTLVPRPPHREGPWDAPHRLHDTGRHTIWLIATSAPSSRRARSGSPPCRRRGDRPRRSRSRCHGACPSTSWPRRRRCRGSSRRRTRSAPRCGGGR